MLPGGDIREAVAAAAGANGEKRGGDDDSGQEMAGDWHCCESIGGSWRRQEIKAYRRFAAGLNFTIPSFARKRRKIGHPKFGFLSENRQRYLKQIP
jgi:hypothetical protein